MRHLLPTLVRVALNATCAAAVTLATHAAAVTPAAIAVLRTARRVRLRWYSQPLSANQCCTLAASFSQPMHLPSCMQLCLWLAAHRTRCCWCVGSVSQHTFRATASGAWVLLLIERATLWQQRRDGSASQCTFRAARLHFRLVAHQTCCSCCRGGACNIYSRVASWCGGACNLYEQGRSQCKPRRRCGTCILVDGSLRGSQCVCCYSGAYS